ncbi:hypothetical protein FRB99_005633, partial [Tulasnella sp. 403]
EVQKVIKGEKIRQLDEELNEIRQELGIKPAPVPEPETPSAATSPSPSSSPSP